MDRNDVDFCLRIIHNCKSLDDAQDFFSVLAQHMDMKVSVDDSAALEPLWRVPYACVREALSELIFATEDVVDQESEDGVCTWEEKYVFRFLRDWEAYTNQT